MGSLLLRKALVKISLKNNRHPLSSRVTRCDTFIQQKRPVLCSLVYPSIKLPAALKSTYIQDVVRWTAIRPCYQERTTTPQHGGDFLPDELPAWPSCREVAGFFCVRVRTVFFY